jgi:NAD(P)-dependent dehydrogenase (short-subunit alcohol dehydrogenase family)
MTGDGVPPIDDWNRLLEGRVAVITGGGAGIGAGIARLFAAHGALVEVAEIDRELAGSIRDEVSGAGGSIRSHVADVTVDDDVARLAVAVLTEHARVDVLVNNVGDYRPLVPFHESTPDSWQQMYDINLRHVFAVTRAFVPSMIEAGRGSIVTVHSVEGMRGYPKDPVYGAMKAAAAHFTTCLAVDLGRHGIRVNGIGTDLAQTPQVDYLTGYEDTDELWASWAPVGPREGRFVNRSKNL